MGMIRTTPFTGDVVHYVSYGTPGGEYPKACRAAVVTEVGEYWVPDGQEASPGRPVSLRVLNPTGQFFNRGVGYDPGTYTAGERAAFPAPLITCADLEFDGGTWHFIAHPEAS